jgi:WD40 repeat protein/tetratricopeptide (TPR) repeat protein
MVTPPTIPVIGTADHLDAEDPWPGLDPYREEQASFFFGREAEADELLERVSKKSFTLLYAQSGIGKTSLLNAGLYPKLREHDFLPVDLRLDFAAEESLEKQAIRQIHQAFEFLDVVAPQPDDSLWFWLHRKDVQFRTRDGREIKPVFVFDQFEEFFTIGAETDNARERSQGFLEQLADLVENRAPVSLTDALKKDPSLGQSLFFVRQDYRILISIREDYLAYVESLALRMPSIGENRTRLVQMNGVQAFQAVNNPGKQITTPLVSRQIVRKVASLRRAQKNTAEQPTDETWEGLQKLRIEPSFLSLVCRELNRWRRLKGIPQLTSELVSTTGAIESILSDFYERCLADQPAAVRLYVEDELLTKSGFRENKSLEDAEDYLKERGVDPAAVKVLVNRRLLRIDERLDVKRVELTHDILAEVVQASRDSRRAREEKEALERQQREAAEAQKAAEARERQTRRRLYLARFAIVVMVALLGWALWSAEQARRAEKEALDAKQDALNAKRDALNAKQEAENANAKSEESLVGQSYSVWQNGDVGEARHLLDEALGPGYLPGWEWYFVKGLCDLSARDSKELLGHKGAVSALVEIPLQKRRIVASGGEDGTVRLWDVLDGSELKTLGEERNGIGFGFLYQQREQQGFIITELIPNAPAAADRRLKVGDRILRIADANGDLQDVAGLTLEQMSQRLKGDQGTKGRIEIEHPEKGGREIVELTRQPFSQEIKHHGRITRLAASVDGTYLASVDDQNQLYIWNLKSGHLANPSQRPLSDFVNGLAFSPDNHWLAICIYKTNKVILWNLKDDAPAKIEPKHDKPITAVAFATDGGLATASGDGMIKFWDLDQGKELPLQLTAARDCSELVFGRDGHSIAANNLWKVQLFDLNHPEKPPAVFGGTNLVTWEFAFQSSGKYLATAGSDGVIRLWSVRSGKEVRKLRGHTKGVKAVTFLGDNLSLVSGSFDGSIRVWDLRRKPQPAERSFRADDDTGIRFSGDGRYLAEMGTKQIKILDASDCRELRTIPMEGFRTEFSPSGPVIAVPDQVFNIQLVDVTTGVQVPHSHLFWKHWAKIESIAFGPEGKSFISADDDGNVFIWDVATGDGRALKGFNKSPVREVAFSPDGKWVAAASTAEEKVCIWEAATGGLAREVKKPTFGHCLRFSPNSEEIVVDEKSGLVHLVNVKTGEDQELQGHTSFVFDAAFSPDGRRLVTVGDDHATRLWDVKTGKKIFDLDREHEFYSVAFSHDGQRLAAAGGWELKLWDAAVLVPFARQEEWPLYAARSAYDQSAANWANAIASCTKALELGATDPRILIRRGLAYAELGHLDDAEKDFSAVEANSAEAIDAHSYLCDALLAEGRLPEFCDVCRKSAERAAKDHTSHASNAAAWECSLIPAVAVDLGQLVELMRQAVKDRPESYDIRSTMGGLLYRNGDYQGAIDTLHEAMNLNKNTAADSTASNQSVNHDKDGTAFDWVVLAMAHFRLGHQQEAEKWLQQADDRLQMIDSDPIAEDPNYTWHWNDKVQLRALYKEAEELIRKKDSSTRPTVSDR